MRLLVEQQHYTDSDIRALLPEHFWQTLRGGVFKTTYVGYFRNDDAVVLILPKIFADTNNCVFGAKLNDIAQKETNEVINDPIAADFLYRYAMLVYRSLQTYNSRRPENESTEQGDIAQIISNVPNSEHTEIDIVISLYDFYRKNTDLLVLRPQERNSNAFEKTKWQRTIAKKTAFMTAQNEPIYNGVVTQQQVRANDDELLLIFYAVLHYLSAEYGFPVKIPSVYPFERIKRSDFVHFAHRSIQKIKAARHRYFNDRLRKLAALLLLLFEKARANNRTKSEYVLCDSYHTVFEDMIDRLLSDENTDLSHLKNQQDGKIIDHLFQYDSLLDADKIYFVGDSKYYQNANWGAQTIYKQHTYAKNIIQYHINLFNAGKLPQGLYYRDDLTEGYNITPNFFIQAAIDYTNFADDSAHFELEDTKPQGNFHFKNRVFDRDSLLIQHFKVNFLYVLRSYTLADAVVLAKFSATAHHTIREQSVQYYNDNYDFYTIQTTDNALFIQKYFKLLNGKIFRDATKNLILGLSKNADFEDENQDLLRVLATEKVHLDKMNLGNNG
jgi:hypothetical protein